MSKQIKVLGKSSAPQHLANAVKIKEFIVSLILELGMQPLGDPQIYDVPIEIEKLGREPFEDEGGVSCLACLSTSHCAIHTWPVRSEFHIDIYSCRAFDEVKIVNMIREKLQVTRYQAEDLSFACEWSQ